MSKLKWSLVKKELDCTDNKLQYVTELFSKYDTSSKYAVAFHHLAKEILKFTAERTAGLHAPSSQELGELVGLVLCVVRVTGADEGVKSFVNKIAPHIIRAVFNVAGKEALNHLYEVTSALYPTIRQFGKQSSNSSIAIVCLKAVTKLKQDPDCSGLKVQLFMSALSFVLLSVDSKPFSNIAANTVLLLRGMKAEECAEYYPRLWDLVDWCLSHSKAAELFRLPDLFFLLIQNNMEDSTLDLARARSVLTTFIDKIQSQQNLSPLFDLVMRLIAAVSGDEELTEIEIPSSVLEIFNSTQNANDTIWILLAVCRFVCHILIKQTNIPTSWLSFVFQACKLMSRSPQKAVQEAGLALLDHVYANTGDLETFVSSDEGYTTYTSLLKLSLHLLKIFSSAKFGTTRFQEHLEEVAGMISDPTKQIHILELGTLVPGHKPHDQYLLRLVVLLRSQGHLSDAITLLTTPGLSCDMQLYLAICYISKLEVELAASILTGLKVDGSASCVSLLLTYCGFITALKTREPFTLPNSITFCREADEIISSPHHDDCVLSVVMFLSGLYGLDTVTAQCAGLMSSSPANLVSVLSAVPALLANKIQISWNNEMAVLTDGTAEKELIQDIMENHRADLAEKQTDKQADKQTDKQTGSKQASTENNLYCGVCSFVMLNKMLDEGCDIYDVSGDCMMFSLNAAHTKLKSWNQASMSTRALLWQNCGVIPYTLQVLWRYINLLYNWGSVHLTFAFLDRLKQLAKFTRSEYWLAKHRNLEGMVRVTLQYSTKPLPPILNTQSKCRLKHAFAEECLELERYLIAETELISRAVERSNRAIAARDQVGGAKEEGLEEVIYPLFPSTLSPAHRADLTLLQLSLYWSKAPPTQELMVEYYSILKLTRDGVTSRDASEVRRSTDAWIALLASYLKPGLEVSGVPLSKKPIARRGRSRKQSAKGQTAKQTSVKQTSAKHASVKQTSVRQTAAKDKQSSGTPSVDYIQIGLEACTGLEPVVVKRELLKRKISRDPTWADIEEFHNLPFQHVLRDMLRDVTRDGSRVVSDVTPDSGDGMFPESWTVANITKIGNVLYIGQRRSESQVVYKRELPFTLKSQVGGQNTSCLDEMKRIIESNDDSVTLIKDKTEFWKCRFELDSSLKKLLDKLETDWLGPWKGLLLGKPIDLEYSKNIKMSAANLRKEIKSKYKVSLDVFLSQYLLDHYSLLSEDNISELLTDQVPLADILPVLHDLAPAAPPTRYPVLLTLDQDTNILPWEACGAFSNQPIARIPSCRFAFALLTLRSLPVKLKKEETYYILNPTQNLPSTQAYFETWLEEQAGWRGVAAKPPSVPEYQTALESDLFLYLGHGSGKEFLGGKSIQDFKSRAVALLMGCNSAKIKHTPVGGTGTPIEYLLSGCPAVVGYLWNITDRDCDRYSKKLLELWLSEGHSTSLLSLMNPSRSACKLPYLVGAAPVLYGIPDILTGTSGS